MKKKKPNPELPSTEEVKDMLRKVYEEPKWVTEYNQPRFRPVWQLCPKCGGSGQINAFGNTYRDEQNTAVSNKQCPVCNGRMIISTPTE